MTIIDADAPRTGAAVIAALAAVIVSEVADIAPAETGTAATVAVSVVREVVAGMLDCISVISAAAVVVAAGVAVLLSWLPLQLAL